MMNKKMTTRVINFIVIQAVVVLIAVTAVGGAVRTHNDFKDTGKTSDTTEAPSVRGETTTVKNPLFIPTTTAVPETEPSSAPDTTTKKQKLDYDNPASEYAYAGFHPKTTDVNADLSRFIVNGDYCLPTGYVPKTVPALKGDYTNVPYEQIVELDYRVAPHYQKMYDAAKADGITLTPISGYRRISTQKRNFENRISLHEGRGMNRTDATVEAAKIIMLPGCSEHNAGIAMDICSLSQSFEHTEEYDWLIENCADYGFILRYPKDKVNITKVVYEPWHYRYVGVATAKEIMSRHITLEEYLGLA